MSQPALRFERVSRSFGRKVALRELDLLLPPGRILGLIGRNGAGKTTALRLAQGQLHPDEGTIRVLGLDPATHGLEVRRKVAILSEESALYPWMTVKEILEFAGSLHPGWDASLAEGLVKRLELDPAPRIKSLSRGTKAKVSLVLAVACRPGLLLLDDPTAGLDPLVRREVLQGVLESVSEGGGAVVYASHLIQDVERVADNVAFLDDGKVVLDGTLEDVKARVRQATAVFDDGAPSTLELEGQIDLQTDGRVLTVVAETTNGGLDRALRDAGARDVQVRALSLEEILVACLRRGGTREAGHV